MLYVTEQQLQGHIYLICLISGQVTECQAGYFHVKEDRCKSVRPARGHCRSENENDSDNICLSHDKGP